MGDRGRLLRFRIDCTRPARPELDLRVAQHPSETDVHVVARVLTRIVFDAPEIELGAGVCRGEEPDVGVERDGRFVLWIEVGKPAAARVEHALRRSDRVVVVAYDRPEQVVRALRDVEPRRGRTYELLALEPRALAALAGKLDRDNRWTVEHDDAEVRVSTAGARHAIALLRPA